jgi:hypothetical protein
MITARRPRRAKAASDAYVLSIAARCVAEERARRHAAFDSAIAEFNLPRLTTESVLDLYLAGVGA